MVISQLIVHICHPFLFYLFFYFSLGKYHVQLPSTNLQFHKASQVWKAIEKARKLIGRGACLQVGKGRSINVWEDPWFPRLEGLKPTPSHPSHLFTTPLMVNWLINPTNKTWKQEILLYLFDDESIVAIRRITIPQTDR